MHLTDYGYVIDLADDQWRQIRSNLSVFILLCILMICIRIMNTPSTVTSRLEISLTIGCVALLVQHGIQSIIVLLIIYIGYHISQITYKYNTYLSYTIPWIYGITILLFREIHYIPRYYPHTYIYIHPLFSSSYSGLYSWRFPVNFIVLKMISYSIDRTKRYHNRLMRRSNRTTTTNTNTTTATTNTTSTNITNNDTEYTSYDQSSPLMSGFPSSRSISPTSQEDKIERKEPKSGPKDGKGSRLSGSAATAADVSSSGSKGDLNLTTTEDSLPSVYTTTNNSNTTNNTTNNNSSSSNNSASTKVYIPSFTLYMSYILYLPLYIAGPIISYDDYVKDIHYSSSDSDTEKKGQNYDRVVNDRHLSTQCIVYYSIVHIICIIV